MPIHSTTGTTQLSTGGEVASGDPRKTPLAADASAARKVIKEANRVFIVGMCFTFAASFFAFTPLIVPYDPSQPYWLLAIGFFSAVIGMTAMACRISTIIRNSQNRENFAWSCMRSYDRQLLKARSRADDANTADPRRRNAGETGRGGGTRSPAGRFSRTIEHQGKI